MSDGVRSRPPTAPGVNRPIKSETTETAEIRPPAEAQAAAGAAAAKEAPQGKDVFEAASAAARTQVKSQIQAIASRSISDLQFNNQDLAFLATTLIALVKKNPKATRAARTKMFTRAILKGRGKMAKIIERMDEKEAEAMFDDIASILNESPKLAEWIDNVTEEISKLHA